jgi:hypothetical protein
VGRVNVEGAFATGADANQPITEFLVEGDRLAEWFAGLHAPPSRNKTLDAGNGKLLLLEIAMSSDSSDDESSNSN